MGYNVSLGGNSAPKTEEWKRKVGEASKQRMQEPIYKEKIVGILHEGLKVYKQHCIEQGLPLPGYQNGHEVKPEWAEAARQANLGKVHSEETKIKRSQSLLKSTYF